MPTYEYACKSCGKHVEVFKRFSDEPLSECPSCVGQLRKVFHPAGILLKGTGFYKTDNRAKKSESKSDPKSDSKSDSKEATTSGSSSSSGSTDTSSGKKSTA